jgi:putative selenate reductase FAD-binding subunit
MSSHFLKPKNIEEALDMKRTYPGSLFLGGGTEINKPSSSSHADVLISLDALNLKACVKGHHNYILGASSTFQELIDWDECYPPLKEAAGFLYSRNIRNMATVGGNIGVHLKTSYLVPILMVSEADLELGDDQVIPLEQYVRENRNELILNIRFPHAAQRIAAVKNITKKAGGECVASAAVSLEREEGKIRKAAIAVGGFFDRVTRLEEVEKGLMEGRLQTGEDVQDAVNQVVEAVDDYMGTAAYKKYICGIIVADCVARCMRESV